MGVNPAGSERSRGSIEIVRVIQNGSMPPGLYTTMHPNANLTPAEKQQLIDGLLASLKISAWPQGSCAGFSQEVKARVLAALALACRQVIKKEMGLWKAAKPPSTTPNPFHVKTLGSSGSAIDRHAPWR